MTDEFARGLVIHQLVLAIEYGAEGRGLTVALTRHRLLQPTGYRPRWNGKPLKT
jgi:hypothetical protein